MAVVAPVDPHTIHLHTNVAVSALGCARLSRPSRFILLQSGSPPAPPSVKRPNRPATSAPTTSSTTMTCPRESSSSKHVRDAGRDDDAVPARERDRKSPTALQVAPPAPSGARGTKVQRVERTSRSSTITGLPVPLCGQPTSPLLSLIDAGSPHTALNQHDLDPIDDDINTMLNESLVLHDVFTSSTSPEASSQCAALGPGGSTPSVLATRNVRSSRPTPRILTQIAPLPALTEPDMTSQITSTTPWSILGSAPHGILGKVARGEAVARAERRDNTEIKLLKPSSADLEGSAMKGWPLLFHQTHSDNIQLSLDRRRAKRFESFCKGICFSNRPIAVSERVYLKFSEVSTSWSGVVRFGVTSHDPTTINGSELPRYACPDLTNKPGYWAKAVPERFAEQSNTLYFYVTRTGDVMFGLNNEDKGLFFSGVNTASKLWGLVDIYGNSTSMEFVDGRQLNNLSPSSGVPASTDRGAELSAEMMQAYAALHLQQPPGGTGQTHPGLSPGGGHSQSMPSLPAAGSGGGSAGAVVPVGSGGLPVRYHTSVSFAALPFHTTTLGRNVCLSSDKTMAVRLVEEYCNGYVFTSRPLRPGEHMVIQILSVDTAFVGGLAFGMTACDPIQLNPAELPDDSDLLLDRPEYWVVNKDVCSAPVVGDELSFHLTDDGEIRYGKNGHHVATLMHVDKTLPLWAFFDVYGSTQKLKSLGIISGLLPMSSQHRASIGSGSGLTVALPPPRTTSSPSPVLFCAAPSTWSSTSAGQPAGSGLTPPPRPPPPRGSPSSRGHQQHSSPSALLSTHSPDPTNSSSSTPPSLPPKQFRPLPAPPPPPGTILQPMPASAAALSAVPPAVQLSEPPPPPPPVAPRTLTFTPTQTTVAAPPRPVVMHPNPTGISGMTTNPHQAALRLQGDKGGSAESEEALDNASNECSVCFENAVDCVLYTCGHMCLCYDCAVDIKDNQSALCPICRQAIKDIIKIYRS